ncbi:MAG TPA: T9SS type A sorting domain-containing protein [Saprospiraceae bacterium]|nr:T9SS type A sorting domain-containing protein [Saprospiraceae bacterium]
MAKTMTFKSLFALLLLAFSFQVTIAQTPFWTETYSDQATAVTNWVHGGTNAGANNLTWEWTNDLDAGAWNGPTVGIPTGDTGYFWFDSDGNGAGAHDVTLTGVGNPANCTGKSDVHLRFYTYFRTFSGADVARIGISTDGTNFTYHNVPEFDNLIAETPTVFQFYQGWIDIAIPEADNKAQVWVQFRWEGDFEYYWKVDDLEMYEFSTPVHDVTFQVNAANITVDPAGMKIAGSMTNWSDVDMTNQGGGVWSVTLALEEGAALLYKFKNGPNGWEQGQSGCGVDDGFGGYNRTHTVGTEDETLAAICFNSCDPCVLPCPQNPNKIVCDNMDQYNTTQKLAQQNVAQNGAANSWWTTWSGATGTTEDGIVSTEQANSAPNSFKILTTAAAGGPQDVVLKLGNKTTGRYELKWMYYVPAGKQAYYNIQNVVPIGAGAWNLDAFFQANNAGVVRIGAGPILAEFTYPNGEWFEVRHIIDLDNNLLTMWVDGQYVIKMAYPNNLGGIDFYGIDNNHTNYIDDVEYVQLPSITFNADFCASAVDLSLYFGQATTQTTPIQDNTNITTSATDPEVTCWGEDVAGNQDVVNTSMWYTFTGDGEKYHIETVPCNATNYIGVAQDDPGDTQMLIYAGDDCDDLTEVACNDDLNFALFQDWRSGLDLETVDGQNYYMLIDGFQFNNVVAEGEFCIEITKVPSVTCADGAVGSYEVSSNFLCFEANLADLITIDANSFVLPNSGAINGMAWAITSAPCDPNVLPTSNDILVGSTGFLQDPFVVGYVNGGDPFPFNVYYITPIVVGDGIDGNPATQGANLFELDASNACFFIGQSTPIVFLPLTDDITVTAVAGPGSVNATPSGGIADIIGDPISYTYLWSNGATTQDLSGVAPGTYTVTVSDDCSLAGTASATVTVSGTEDPASITSFIVSPNPTSGVVTMNLALATAAEVRIEIVNTLGQTLQTINAGKMSNISQNVDLSNLSQGSYFLRVTVDGETAIRKVVLQK